MIVDMWLFNVVFLFSNINWIMDKPAPCYLPNPIMKAYYARSIICTPVGGRTLCTEWKWIKDGHRTQRRSWWKGESIMQHNRLWDSDNKLHKNFA